MATMLGYVATDAAVPQALLQQLVSDAANRSFNRITIDGDTSTNDSFMLIASGEVALPGLDDAESREFAALREAVIEVSIELAQAIVRDGEGHQVHQRQRARRQERSRVPRRCLRHCPFATGENRFLRFATRILAVCWLPSVTLVLPIWMSAVSTCGSTMCGWPKTAVAIRITRKKTASG